ncbi:MAG: hypothetical protein GYA51_17420 [Candidatus Methanofastidiosa archaeon]|nr:hypothetical protein [Candidatus Methanofastidiosa archaeon]
MMDFVAIIGTYIFLLIGLYYLYSGKSIFPFFLGAPEDLRRFTAWSYILGGLLFQFFLLFVPLWSSGYRVELKILITALYAVSTGWIFFITYKKYKLRKSKLDANSKEQEQEHGN